MAKPSIDSKFTFVGGLNTEGGYFVSPPNTWKEGTNMVPQLDGSIERRKAIDFEEGGVEYDIQLLREDASAYAFSINIWEAVGGNGNLDLFVVQIGNMLYFYNASSEQTSESKYNFTVNLNDYQCYGNTDIVAYSRVSTATCYGKLVVTSKNTEPILISFDSALSQFTVQVISIEIRDFTGIRSPRPASTEYTEAQWDAIGFWPEAKYNLYNQGWSDEHMNAYKNARGNKYPSNQKIWVYGKDSNDDFDVDILDKQDFGSIEAPKGRVILQAFYQDRAKSLETQYPTSNLPSEATSSPNTDSSYEWTRESEISTPDRVVYIEP